MLCPVTSESLGTVTFTQIFSLIVSSFDGRCSEYKALIRNYYFLSYEVYFYYIFKAYFAM